jgi:tetratricopeptide (TPR) repeat protein
MNPRQLFEQALRAHRARRLPEAAQRYEDVLRWDPSHVGALTNLGLARGEMGLLDAAERALREAERLAPRSADVQANLALVLHERKRYAAAIDACERGLKLSPDNKLRRKLQNTLATSLVAAARYDDAIALLTRMVDAAPGYAQGHALLGSAYAKLGRCDDAVRAFARATELDSRDSVSFVAAGECLMVARRAAEALPLLERGLAIDPADQRGLALKALALAELGRVEDERWLADPHHFVQRHPLDTLGYSPDEAAQLTRDLSAFASNEPSLREDPPEYATTKAWHSTVNMADDQSPVIARFKALVERVFAQRVASLASEDPKHPFVTSAPPRYHLDLWAVRMKGGGGQLLPHIHVSGWLSGVYYVDVPRLVNDPAANQAGWIEFGAPRSDIVLTRSPILRRVQPSPGLLITFPSYIWHDTVPLPVDNDEQRLVLAFDLHPVRS